MMAENATGSAAVQGQQAQGTVQTVGQGEFRRLPLDLIIVEEQVRTGVDLESESFKGLMDSIAAKGVYQPVTVIPRDDKYLLILGERRFLACRQLGLADIPAYVRRDIETKEDILMAQLIENLQREDIDPIDKANGILSLFKLRHGDMDLGAVINTLLTYDRDPGRVKNEFAETVSAIIKSFGKTTRSIENWLSLLKLPAEIQSALKEGTLPVSQGYVFAANLDNPSLVKIFNDVLEKPVTNDQLKMKFVAAAQTGKAKAAWSPQPIKNLRAKVKSVRTMLEIGVAEVAVSEMTDLLADLQSLTQLVQATLDRQANKAAQAAAAKEAKALIAAEKKAAEVQSTKQAAAAANQPAPDAAGATPDAEPSPATVKKTKTAKTTKATAKKKPAKKKVLL